MIRAGDLRRQVTIQQRQSARDADGQASEVWSDVATVSAHIQPMGGRELMLAKAVQALSTHNVTMRWRPLIDARMRLVYEGRIFNIDNINDFDTRHAYLVISCHEGQNVG